MSAALDSRDRAGHGLQDREEIAPGLTRAQRALWLVFFVYVIALISLAKYVRHVIGGWSGLAVMLLILAAGMFLWRKSLPARIVRITTLIGRWSLTLGYWALFAPWALLVKRKNPLQLRRRDSAWSACASHMTTLAEARQQY